MYMTTSVLRVISACACAFLSGYLIQKRNRSQQQRLYGSHLIVLIFAILMVPYEAMGTAWLYTRDDDLLCEGVYQEASMPNSPLCTVQGVILQYLVLVMLFLGLILIIHLHVLTVHQSTWVQSRVVKLMVIAFALPLASVIPTLVKQQVSNPGLGSTCFVDPDMADKLFYIPYAVFVSIALLIHLGTIAYAVKQHWRLALFGFCLIFIQMFSWLFYFIEAKKLHNSGPLITAPWLPTWVACLSDQAAIAIDSGLMLPNNSTVQQLQAVGKASQQTCAVAAQPFVPNFAAACLNEALPAVFGLVILGIFGLRKELWHDMKSGRLGFLCGGSSWGDKTAAGGGGGEGKEKEQDSRDAKSGFASRSEAVAAAAYLTKDDDSSYYGQNFRPKGQPMLSPDPSSSLSATIPQISHLSLLNYRPDTPEPWKPSVWLDTRSTTTNDSDMERRSQLRVDVSPLVLNPVTTAATPKADTSTKRSPVKGSDPQSSNAQDFDDPPINLAVLSSSSSHPHHRHHNANSAANSNNNDHTIANSSSDTNRNSDMDSQLIVVGEASRVLLNYRPSTDMRPQILNIDQQEQQPQRSLSPAPRKHRH
ncbi:hypothetical protein BGX31_007234 [Mortierella sp. GBA43]|nr:hypothetical protein BGX31_007234 [Mortierella sp. GBA43]